MCAFYFKPHRSIAKFPCRFQKISSLQKWGFFSNFEDLYYALYSRELMFLLRYECWGNFDMVICPAMESCYTSGIAVSDHFREVTKMVELGSSAKRNIKILLRKRQLVMLKKKIYKEKVWLLASIFKIIVLLGICWDNEELNREVYRLLKI